MANLKEAPKRASACSLCRSRKVKCDGSAPCSKCSVSGAECVYPESRRGRRKNDSTRAGWLKDRLSQMEAMVQSQSQVSPTTEISAHRPSASCHSVSLTASVPSGTINNVQSEEPALRSDASVASNTAHPPLGTFAPGNYASSYRNPPTLISQSSPSVASHYPLNYPVADYEPKEPPDVAEYDKEASVLAPQIVNWEHHGPGSWLSICSGPGTAWVSQRTGVTSFAESAAELTTTWTRRLSVDRSRFSNTKDNEPDPVTAWNYCNAYFEDSFDSIFGIVYRPEFEAALQAHHRGDLVSCDHAAWFALRKTVYATGCRIYLSKHTSMSFTDIQTEAWRYFQGAMSALVELLCQPSGLLAVRALVAMTFFAEGLGSPATEYILCANAARLAQAKGLHRRPAKAWNLAESDSLHHSWLFWAVYCCEKQIAQRSGRPSAIDDDDISCQIPTDICPGSTINIRVFTAIVQHARISSQISKRLMSVKAFHQAPNDLIEAATDLNRQLWEWKGALPTDMRPPDTLKTFHVAPGTPFTVSMFIHHAYYGSLMAVHTVFAYPWISSILFGQHRSATAQEQIVSSSNTMVEAARNIIVIARSLDITGASIQWSTFYYPMIGLINLFIHVLKFPSIPSARSDVALLDVAAGCFGHMEFVTAGELSFPFARDVARLARQTVNGASRGDAPTMANDNDAVNVNNETDFSSEGIFSNDENFNLDDWSIFSTVLMDDVPFFRDTGLDTRG